MPTNDFYNAIQQLRAQKAQRDTPKAQVTAAPVQTPELDRATGNAGGSASKIAVPGLQINPNWQQAQETKKQQSRTSKYGRTHSKRTSTGTDNIAMDTAGTNSKSPASATGKYDPDSTKATGISNGVPVLTSYDGFKRLDQGISNNTGRTQSQPKRLEMNGKAVSPMLPKYREIVNSGNTEEEIARLEQQLSDLDEQWTAQWQGAMRGVNVNGMTREEYDRQRNAILSGLDVLDKAGNGTLGQRTGAFLKGITGGNMSMEEYKDLPEGVQRAFMRGADIKDAPLMAQIALDNALAKFGNTEAGTVSVSPTDPKSFQTAARFGQMTGLAAGAGIQNAAAGTARAVQMVEDLVNLPHGPITDRIIADRDGIAAKIEDETANWTDKQREYYNYAIEAFRMLPSMATAWATAGGSTVAQAGSQIAAQAAPWTKAVTDFASGFLTNPVFYSTALEVTGNGYEQALAKGADEKHAALYAITNGVLNAMLEVGGAQELPSKIKNKGFQNAFLEYIKSIPEEGLEEVEQGIVEQLLGSVQLGEDNKIVSITDPNAILSFTRAVQEFKGGGVLSSIMGGGSLAINAATGAYRNNPRAERDQQMQESLTPIAAAVLGDQQATTMDRGDTQTVSAGDNRVEMEREELPTAEGRPQPRPTEEGGTIERGEMPGRQETDQREPTPGTNPRADEQAQLEEALNTPQATESADTGEGQAGTSPIAEAILQQRERDSWLDRVEADEAMDNPQEQSNQDAWLDRIEQEQEGEQTPPQAEQEQTPQTPQEQTQTEAEPEPAQPAPPAPPQGTTGGAIERESLAEKLGGQTEQNQQGGRTGIQPVDRGADQNGDLTGTKVSQTAQTVQGAKPTTEDFAALMGREMENGAYRYFPITNDESVNRAIETITDKGWDKALREWQKEVNRGVAGDQMTAIGALLYNNAVNSGDYETATEILSYYAALGRHTARGLQAFRILKDMDPMTRLYMFQQSAKKISEAYANDPDAITIPDELLQRYRNSETDEERAAVLKEMEKSISKQITEKRTTSKAIMEMVTAARYTNMLGNLRTQFRNLGGNTVMTSVSMLKNSNKYLMERLYSLIDKNYERTTSAYVAPYLKAAFKDGKHLGMAVILGEQKYGDTTSPVEDMFRNAEDKHRVFAINSKSDFLNKVVNALLWVPEGYRVATNTAMNVGDYIFGSPVYARALAGYIKANGMSAETFTGIVNGTIEATQEQNALIDRARLYAIKEAREALFRDNNAFSDWVSKIGRRKDTHIIGRIAAEGTAPFRKTPANVLVRGVEYSPLGWLDTILDKGVYRGLIKKNGNAADFINSAAKSLTGTMLFVLGKAMRKWRLVTGGEDDEKQKNLDNLTGAQEYAVRLPGGKSYTMDWAAPASIPFFMGVALQDIEEETGKQLSPENFIEAASAMSQTVIRQSMLSGLNDTLTNIKFSDNNLIQLLAQSGLSYLLQGTTNTLFGQIERIAEDKRYTTWKDPSEPNKVVGSLKHLLNKATAKIPGYDNNQIEYVDAWGRTQDTGGTFEKIVGNMFSPGYISEERVTDIEEELQRLYDAGMSNVTPQAPSFSEKISTFDEHGRKSGERYMSKDEWETYARVCGKTKYEMVSDLMDSNIYDSMTDEARSAAISEIYSYAKHEAARAVEKSVPNSYGDITRTSNPAAYIGMQKAFSTATSDKYSRDYDAVDDLMQQYGRMPMDVRKLLGEKVDGLSKVYAASQAGISSKTYYTTTDAIKAITPPKGNVNPALWQKAEYIGGLKYMPDSQKDFFMGQYFEEGSATKYQTCRDQGYSPKDVAAFYKLKNTIKGDDNNGDGKADSGSAKAKTIAAAVKYGFSQAQAEYLWKVWSSTSK